MRRVIVTYICLYALLCIATNACALSPWSSMDLCPTIDSTDHSRDNQALIAADEALKGADFRCRWVQQRHTCHNYSKEQLMRYFTEISHEHNVLVSVCMYCGMYIRVQALKGGKPGLSHGICEFDYERLWADMINVKSNKIIPEIDNDKVMGQA